MVQILESAYDDAVLLVHQIVVDKLGSSHVIKPLLTRLRLDISEVRYGI